MMNCHACAHSYMEPDSGLICGHPDAGTFGKTIYKEPLDHCGWKKFEQHPGRNPDGSLDIKAIAQALKEKKEKTG